MTNEEVRHLLNIAERTALKEAQEEALGLRRELVKRYDQIEALKKEVEVLKGIERQRWYRVNKVFGTKYSTQMNEGESAKWTCGGQSAAKWGEGK